jgi:FMN-dependent oxidoreductase (nitrilotriacetate monooxygenase family)
MSSAAEPLPHRAGHLVLGATVRALGAWPAGWRYPGAHADPHDDPAVLAYLARSAENAKLDFLFFGDWLATSREFEFTDPYLLARIEPFAAIGYLSALTSTIGLVATINSSYAEPYATARTSASIDILSGGRVGLNIATGAEVRSANNFGWEDIHPPETRLAAAAEVVEILRGLWDSWDDDAFLSDAAGGRLIEPGRIHSLGYVGRHRASAGPLNVLRPPQGHLPIAMAASSDRGRDLAIAYADIALISPPTLELAIEQYGRTKARVAEAGRDPEQFHLLAPVLPIVAPTREEAWDIYDALVDLVPLSDAATNSVEVDLPANRSTRALAGALGVPLRGVLLDEIVPARVVAAFSPLGRSLAQTVQERSGRTVRGERPLTYRHLLVAHAVPAPIVVGSPTDVADHLEHWFRAEAVDGFTVLSAFLTEQFDAFAELVVPELQRRGLYRTEYSGSTLREHLNLSSVTSTFAPTNPPKIPPHVPARARP